MTNGTTHEAPQEDEGLLTPQRAFTLIYGGPGMGKTSVISSVPYALVLDLRGEIARIGPGSKLFKPASCRHLTAAVQRVAQGAYGALCVDGWAELYALIVAEAGAKRIAIDHNPQGRENVANSNIQSHHKVAVWWLGWWLDQLAGLDVPKVATAHHRVWTTELSERTVKEISLDMPQAARQLTMRRADVVLYVQQPPDAPTSQWIAAPSSVTVTEQRPGKGWDKRSWPVEYRAFGKDRFRKLEPRAALSYKALQQQLGFVIEEPPAVAAQRAAEVEA